MSTGAEQADVIEDKVYALLFASWQDGSYWVGEVHENESLGIHALVFCWRGEECESSHQWTANDGTGSVGGAVNFLTGLRTREVERRLPSAGPPSMLDAVIAESGDPLKMKALLKKRERAWQRVAPGRRDPDWLLWLALLFGLPALARIPFSSFRPSLLSLKIFLLVVSLGVAAVAFLMLVESWQVKRLRRKTWRTGPATPAVWSLVAVNVVVFALELAWGGSNSAQTLHRMGAGIGRAGLVDEPWRIVSSAFLHVGVLHLLLNMWALLVFGRLLEVVLGARRFLVLYALCAAAGGLASSLVHAQIVSAGASGAVWGLMTGQITLLMLLKRQEGPERVPVKMSTLMLPLVVNLLVSLIPGIDMAAHIGGGAAGAGLILSGLVRWNRPEPAGWRWAGWGASLAMAACLVAALSHGRPWDVREDPDAYYSRGIDRRAKGDVDGALADFTEAIRLKPDHVPAYCNRGVARRAKGDLDGALADYTEIIRMEPDHAHAYYNRAIAREAKGDVDGALVDYTEFIHLKPNDLNAYYNRAVLWQRKQDHRAAIADLEKYLQLGGGKRDGDQAEVEGKIRKLKRRLP